HDVLDEARRPAEGETSEGSVRRSGQEQQVRIEIGVAARRAPPFFEGENVVALLAIIGPSQQRMTGGCIGFPEGCDGYALRPLRRRKRHVQVACEEERAAHAGRRWCWGRRPPTFSMNVMISSNPWRRSISAKT